MQRASLQREGPLYYALETPIGSSHRISVGPAPSLLRQHQACWLLCKEEEQAGQCLFGLLFLSFFIFFFNSLLRRVDEGFRAMVVWGTFGNAA